MTKQDPELSGAVSSHRAGHFAGPVVIALAALIMLAWSWGTWPDPLVDFGAQLYVPWQLSTGHTLYRDIAYYNGPLSSYFNAMMFRCFGVGLNTLVWVNLLIVAAAMPLAWRITVRASGQLAAVMGGLTFALIFAFGQIAELGNYNWLTPYTHEVTHGTVIGLAAIACANAYLRTDRMRWLIATGALLGAVFLTKAEPTAACFAAVAIQLLAGWWGQRAAFRNVTRASAILFLTAIAFPLAAFVLLNMAMPASQALRGELGSWLWVFDHRVTSLQFYRNVSGLNDVRANLLVMLHWCGAYLILLGSATCVGLSVRSTSKSLARFPPIGAFVLLGCMLWAVFDRIDWTGMLTPLPPLLLAALIFTVLTVARRRADPTRSAVRLSLVVYSIVLIAKMGLKPHPYLYGFVLAWPATAVLLAVVAEELPAWVSRRGGMGSVVRAVGLAMWMAAVAAILRRDAAHFEAKQFTIAVGTPDAFRCDDAGREVQAVCREISQLVPAGGTVAVFPQGLMINYLTRRKSPTKYINFMPPEVLAAGEQNILAALKQHPPDVIVVTSTSVDRNRFTLDGQDAYGAETLQWIRERYSPVDLVKLPNGGTTMYRFLVCRRKG